jgi:hypothetical protein
MAADLAEFTGENTHVVADETFMVASILQLLDNGSFGFPWPAILKLQPNLNVETIQIGNGFDLSYILH